MSSSLLVTDSSRSKAFQLLSKAWARNSYCAKLLKIKQIRLEKNTVSVLTALCNPFLSPAASQGRYLGTGQEVLTGEGLQNRSGTRGQGRERDPGNVSRGSLEHAACPP